MIQVPFGFRVVKITPSLLTLNLERTERKPIPVRPRVIGRPAAGLRDRRSRERPGRGARGGPAQPGARDRERLHRAGLGRGRDRTVSEAWASASRTRCCGSRAAAACASPRACARRRRRAPSTGSRRGARPCGALDAGPRQRVGVGAGVAGASARARTCALRDCPERGAVPRACRSPSRSARAPGVSVIETRPAEVAIRPAGREGAVTHARAERSLFGTDGIRGVANVYPMTPELALALGRAVTFVAGRGAAPRAARADRQGHAPLRLHARDGARRGRHVDGRARAAVRAGADAGGRAPHRQHARRRRHRDQRQPQPLRRQRHQDLRPRRLQAARRGRGRDRDADPRARAARRAPDRPRRSAAP